METVVEDARALAWFVNVCSDIEVRHRLLTISIKTKVFGSVVLMVLTPF